MDRWDRRKTDEVTTGACESDQAKGLGVEGEARGDTCWGEAGSREGRVAGLISEYWGGEGLTTTQGKR